MRKFFVSLFSLYFLLVLVLMTACGSPSDGEKQTDGKTDSNFAPLSEHRTTVSDFLFPDAPGKDVSGTDIIKIDSSNMSEGYIMIKYTGNSEKAKLQMTIPDGTVYNYTILQKEFNAFPLPGGDGSYHIDILELAFEDVYSLAYSEDLQVKLADEFRPFLYPNEYSRYDDKSKAAAYGKTISDASADDLEYISNVYHFVTNTVSYDEELAKNVATDYIPDADKTFESKKGICFDYASLMTVLLRSQGIPTRLVVGYSGSVYHAWISVYLDEQGWVDNVIQFDGANWSLMDPTLAANNSSDQTKTYIGDGSNYQMKFNY